MKPKNDFKQLTPEEMRWTCEDGFIPFETSNDCPYCDEIIGQERALKAIQTGLDIKSLGYNIFITGMVGTGRTTTIKQLLERLEKADKIPDDILYVNNFKYPDEPVLIQLPAGRGNLFAKAMDSLIEMLKTNVPALLKSKYYMEQRDQIVEKQQKKQKETLQAFEEEVAAQGFSVIQVQMGLFTRPDLIPVIDGEPTPFNRLDALVKENKITKARVEELKASYEKLTNKLEAVFEFLKEIDEDTRARLKGWDAESITPIIKGGITEIRAKFPDPKIDVYLTQVEETLIQNIELFKNQKKEEQEKEGFDPFLEYRVNLLVDNAELKGAPVIMETNPNYQNLFGSIDFLYSRGLGVGQTDFTKIKAGSFLKANGGFIVMNALDALVEPGVWATLKRTLRNQIFEIQNYASMFLLTTSRIKPEPIPCNVKVVMIGDSYVYNILFTADEDFKKIFKIKAEFEFGDDQDRRDRHRVRPLHKEDLRRRPPAPLRQGRDRGRGRVRDACRRPQEKDLHPLPRHRRRHPGIQLLGRPGEEGRGRPRGRRTGRPRTHRAGQPDRGQDSGDDRGRHPDDRHRRHGRRAGQRARRL